MLNTIPKTARVLSLIHKGIANNFFLHLHFPLQSHCIDCFILSPVSVKEIIVTIVGSSEKKSTHCLYIHCCPYIFSELGFARERDGMGEIGDH